MGCNDYNYHDTVINGPIVRGDVYRSSLPHLGHATIIDYLKQCIADDNLQAFYHCRPWKRLAKEVLQEQHYECQECKARGRYTRATIVHHVKHIRQYPAYAMSKLFLEPGGIWRRNLIAVCKYCHETVCHPERLQQAEKQASLTVERW